MTCSECGEAKKTYEAFLLNGEEYEFEDGKRCKECIEKLKENWKKYGNPLNS